MFASEPMFVIDSKLRDSVSVLSLSENLIGLSILYGSHREGLTHCTLTCGSHQRSERNRLATDLKLVLPIFSKIRQLVKHRLLILVLIVS